MRIYTTNKKRGIEIPNTLCGYVNTRDQWRTQKFLKGGA
jgi:hypothetical protein